jgi:hypothetical protein
LVAADFLLSKKEDLAQKLNIDIAGIEQLLLAPRNLSFDGLLQWFQLAYICPFDAGKDDGPGHRGRRLYRIYSGKRQ